MDIKGNTAALFPPFGQRRPRGRLVSPLLGAAAALMLACPFTGAHAASGDDRPNIVVIMADDMGFSDIGCYGAVNIETPNLDALAEDGLRFTRFYNAARCCPTRAALLTGLYPHQAGIGGMTRDQGLPGYRGRLNERSMTIGAALQRAGYRTMAVGKWHVGDPQSHWPLQRGFDRYYGVPRGGGVYFKENFQTRGAVQVVLDNETVEVPDDWYITHALTDHAIRFLEEDRPDDKPFFLYFAHIAPHWPLQAPAETIDRYREKFTGGWDELRRQRYEKMKRLGLAEPGWSLPPRDEKAKAWSDEPAKVRKRMARRMAVYAAQVHEMDRSVGRVVDALKRMGELRETVIFFLSDNGASAEGGPHGFNWNDRPADEPGSYASYGLSWANASDTPFRRYKAWTHEGGISTPLIVHWPNGLQTEGGALTDQVGHVIDLMPTCLDLAGASRPEARGGNKLKPLAGESLVPVLRGDSIGKRTLYWEHMGHRAVRDGRWKLVAAKGQPWHLYDIAEDRAELNDLASEHPDRVRRMKRMYDQWADRSNVLSRPLKQHK